MRNRMSRSKAVGVVMLVVGPLILLGALTADLVGLGGYPSLGMRQMLGALVGTGLAVGGAVLLTRRLKRRRRDSSLSDLWWGIFRKVRLLALVVGIMVWVASSNIMQTGRSAISELRFILKNPSLSYDQKMEIRWGVSYKFLNFVRGRTPPTSVMVKPPSQVKPWWTVGNELLIYYFLYPRRVLHTDGRGIESNQTITHVLVAWGSWWVPDPRRWGWPKFAVNGKRFIHLPNLRKIYVGELALVSSNLSRDLRYAPPDLGDSDGLLVNYHSDAEKESIDHRLVEFQDRLTEYFGVAYTLNNYDYWTRPVDVPLTDKVRVTAKIRADTRHSVNLIAEVRYGNGRLAIFGSAPNRQTDSWELLSIDDIYQRAKEYGPIRGWDPEKMEVTRIGVNTGFPLEMPYLEKYGVIELERGLEERKGEVKVESAPILFSRGNFYKARNQLEEAIVQYRLAEKLNPADSWIHHNLADVYRRKGDLAKAISEYQVAISLNPQVAWFYFALGEAYQERGKIDLAIRNLEKSLELDPLATWADGVLKDIRKRETERG